MQRRCGCCGRCREGVLTGADERRYDNIWQTVNMGATRRRCLRSPHPDGFSRLRVTCRRDLKIFQKSIPGPEVQEGTDSPEKTGSGWAGMVRHSWRGAFLWRLAGVGARRREAPHAQPAHCPTAPTVASTRLEPTPAGTIWNVQKTEATLRSRNLVGAAFPALASAFCALAPS